MYPRWPLPHAYHWISSMASECGFSFCDFSPTLCWLHATERIVASLTMFIYQDWNLWAGKIESAGTTKLRQSRWGNYPGLLTLTHEIMVILLKDTRRQERGGCLDRSRVWAVQWLTGHHELRTAATSRSWRRQGTGFSLRAAKRNPALPTSWF